MHPDCMTIWDPGIDHDPSKKNKLLKINVSLFIYSFLATIVAVKADERADIYIKYESRTELDPHV